MMRRALMAALVAVPAFILPSVVRAVEYEGLGNESQGAGVAFAKIKGDKVDIVVMANDNPKGANNLRYRVGFEVDASGNPRSWSPAYTDAGGVGNEAQGAGVVVEDIDKSGRPDMLLMAYDNPGGFNSFRVKVGRNLDTNGKASSWSGPFDTSGVGNDAQGAGLALAKLDTNDNWDLVLMAYDDPKGPNSFRYRVCLNINLSNPLATCSGETIEVPGVGSDGQGAGIAVVDLDHVGGPEMVLMAYDRSGEFRYRVGYNLNASGKAKFWTAEQKLSGLGASSQGADVAFPVLSGTAPTAVFMMYDNPKGANNFRCTYDSALPARLIWDQLAMVHIDGRVAFTNGVESTQKNFAKPDWINIALTPIVNGMGSLYVPESMSSWLKDTVQGAVLDGAGIYLDAAGSVAGAALSDVLAGALLGRDYLRWAQEMLNGRVNQAKLDLKAAQCLQSTSNNAFVRLTRKTTELRNALEEERAARKSNNQAAVTTALQKQLAILDGSPGDTFTDDRLLNGPSIPLIWEAANQEKQFKLQLDPKNYQEYERKAAGVKVDFVHRVLVASLQAKAITGWLKDTQAKLK